MKDRIHAVATTKKVVSLEFRENFVGLVMMSQRSTDNPMRVYKEVMP